MQTYPKFQKKAFNSIWVLPSVDLGIHVRNLSNYFYMQGDIYRYIIALCTYRYCMPTLFI